MEFVIQGSVTDDSGVAEVKVNNRAISVSTEGDFTASVSLVEGGKRDSCDGNRYTWEHGDKPIHALLQASAN